MALIGVGLIAYWDKCSHFIQSSHSDFCSTNVLFVTKELLLTLKAFESESLLVSKVGNCDVIIRLELFYRPNLNGLITLRVVMTV